MSSLAAAVEAKKKKTYFSQFLDENKRGNKKESGFDGKLVQ